MSWCGLSWFFQSIWYLLSWNIISQTMVIDTAVNESYKSHITQSVSLNDLYGKVGKSLVPLGAILNTFSFLIHVYDLGFVFLRFVYWKLYKFTDGTSLLTKNTYRYVVRDLFPAGLVIFRLKSICDLDSRSPLLFGAFIYAKLKIVVS